MNTVNESLLKITKEIAEKYGSSKLFKIMLTKNNIEYVEISKNVTKIFDEELNKIIICKHVASKTIVHYEVN